MQPNTRLFFGETVGNPGMEVLDIPTIAQIAHSARVPLLVDSTLTTPWLVQPLAHGADLVLHSATKFLSGHGTVVGGVVVDGGSFDWEAAGHFPELTTPYDGFHGMVFSEESTVGAFLLPIRWCRVSATPCWNHTPATGWHSNCCRAALARCSALT